MLRLRRQDVEALCVAVGVKCWSDRGWRFKRKWTACLSMMSATIGWGRNTMAFEVVGHRVRVVELVCKCGRPFQVRLAARSHGQSQGRGGMFSVEGVACDVRGLIERCECGRSFHQRVALSGKKMVFRNKS